MELALVITEVQAALRACGWTPIHRSSAIAVKTYPTAVGLKDAHVYLKVLPTECWLTAEYYSEGRNALSTVIATWPATLPTAELAAKITRVCADIDATVQATYACSLLAGRS